MKEFEVINRTNGLKWLKLEPKLLKNAILYANENGIRNFICHWHPLDGIEDFSYLDKLDVAGLNITFSGIKSNESLNKLGNLEILICLFSEPISLLDFSLLSKLKILEITYNNKIQGLSSLGNLLDLRLWKYKPDTKNLIEFKAYRCIRKVMLVKPVIDSLDGIEALEQLVELEITRPNGFGIVFKSSKKSSLLNLKSLTFSFCKELDFNSIPTLKNLASLIITDSSKISTLRDVVEQLPNLKVLIVTRTELLDGNLDYLLEHPTLEKVTIDHKRHYNMKEQAINKLLGEKRGKK